MENKNLKVVEETAAENGKSQEVITLEAEIEQLKKDLTSANELVKNYETAYQELTLKYNKLYSILGSTIDCAINLK